MARTGTSRARTSGNGTTWDGASRTGASRPHCAVNLATRWFCARSAPAIRVVLLDRWPGPVVPARGAARRARSRRPVQAVRPRWHPPPVRQPIPARSRRAAGTTVGAAGIWACVRHCAVGYRPPIRTRPAMGGRSSASRGSVVRGRTVRGSAVRGSAVRHATARAAGIRPARMLCAHRWCAHRRRADRWSGRVRPARVRRSAVRDRPVRSPVRVADMRSAPVRVAGVRPATVRVAARARRPAVGRRRVRCLSMGYWSVRCRSVRCRSVRRAVTRPAAARLAPGHRGSGHPGGARAPVRRRTWREAARLRPSRLADPRLPGRHLGRAPQRVPEFVVLSLGSAACPGRIIFLRRVSVIGGIRPRSIATAVPLVPGRTVRVTAEAGVATFHPIPPGPLCPAGAAGHLPSPLECRSTEIPCMT
jgi:hypothetical protein